MRKIHVTRQFFEAGERPGDLIEKTRSMGVRVPKFRSVSFFVWQGDVTQLNTYTNIQVKLGMSFLVENQ